MAPRLRAATGPDRELDAAIMWMAGDWKNLGGGWRRHKKTGAQERFGYTEAPAFTASVDAALTLVPDGRSRELYDGGSICEAIIYPPDDDASSYGSAPTIPLAICIAALSVEG